MTETTAGDAQRRLPFEFTGTAVEYFGIWIVNLFLTIITVGTYSAWAKVRRLRYFYGNTWLDGHNFEYHARPLQILIGRIIVVGYLVFVNVVGEVSPVASGLLLLPYVIALPWVFNKAIAFNARMTSYRNVHFSFEGSYLKALGIFIGLPLLVFVPVLAAGGLNYAVFGEGDIGAGGAVLTLAGVLASAALIPFVTQAGINYIGNNTRFGTAKFTTDAPLRLIFQNLTMSVSFAILFAGVTLAMVAGTLFSIDDSHRFSFGTHADPEASFGIVALFLLAGILIYIPFILAYTFYSAGNRNIAFNHTTLEDGHRFVSVLSRLRYVWIIVSNLVVTLATLALMRPWAAIRTWRYITTSTAMLPSGTLDSFIDVQAEQGNVAAAEYVDIDGIDFGL